MIEKHQILGWKIVDGGAHGHQVWLDLKMEFCFTTNTLSWDLVKSSIEKHCRAAMPSLTVLKHFSVAVACGCPRLHHVGEVSSC